MFYYLLDVKFLSLNVPSLLIWACAKIELPFKATDLGFTPEFVCLDASMHSHVHKFWTDIYNIKITLPMHSKRMLLIKSDLTNVITKY